MHATPSGFSPCSHKPKYAFLQTLIKLERWLDAVEFCNRALHVDGKCVKALSRRASAFVKVAGERSASVDDTTGAAATTTTAAAAMRSSTLAGSSIDEVEVVKGGSSDSIDISSSTTTENVNETIPGTTGEEEGEHAFHKCFGGREGLRAQALLDLDAAVEVDPDGEDVRRQRDALRQEIEEEKVRIHHRNLNERSVYRQCRRFLEPKRSTPGAFSCCPQ